MLIQISNDRWQRHWIAVPAFPRLTATAFIDEGGFSSLNYRIAENYKGSREPEEPRVQELLAEASAMLRRGILQKTEHVSEMIALLRHQKMSNPAAAIVAAHICDRVGDLDQIADMQNYPIGGGRYTPYDLVLFSREGKPEQERLLIGRFPFLARGWGLLAAAEFEVDPRLLNVVSGLLPCVWTMANAKAGEILADITQERQQQTL